MISSTRHSKTGTVLGWLANLTAASSAADELMAAGEGGMGIGRSYILGTSDVGVVCSMGTVADVKPVAVVTTVDVVIVDAGDGFWKQHSHPVEVEGGGVRLVHGGRKPEDEKHDGKLRFGAVFSVCSFSVWQLLQ
jgi:hypothetical protein